MGVRLGSAGTRGSFEPGRRVAVCRRLDAHEYVNYSRWGNVSGGSLEAIRLIGRESLWVSVVLESGSWFFFFAWSFIICPSNHCTTISCNCQSCVRLQHKHLSIDCLGIVRYSSARSCLSTYQVSMLMIALLNNFHVLSLQVFSMWCICLPFGSCFLVQTCGNVRL